jgi:hypothetical protein
MWVFAHRRAVLEVRGPSAQQDVFELARIGAVDLHHGRHDRIVEGLVRIGSRSQSLVAQSHSWPR